MGGRRRADSRVGDPVSWVRGGFVRAQSMRSRLRSPADVCSGIVLCIEVLRDLDESGGGVQIFAIVGVE